MVAYAATLAFGPVIWRKHTPVYHSMWGAVIEDDSAWHNKMRALLGQPPDPRPAFNISLKCGHYLQGASWDCWTGTPAEAEARGKRRCLVCKWPGVAHVVRERRKPAPRGAARERALLQERLLADLWWLLGQKIKPPRGKGVC